MCFPFRMENIWFGKIQQTSISSTSYKAAGVWPPTDQWLVVGKKWEAGVFKEERSLETTSDMYQYIGVRLHVYSMGGVWRQRLGWDIFIFEAACGGGGCLIQNEKGRKWIPNGNQTVTAKATQLRYIQYIHQTNIFLCAGQVARRGRVRLGKTREERRRRSGIGGEVPPFSNINTDGNHLCFNGRTGPHSPSAAPPSQNTDCCSRSNVRILLCFHKFFVPYGLKVMNPF